MFEISVENEFCAAHALRIGTQREPVHGHNWHITVTVAGADLDDDGLLLDFHALERTVEDVIGPFRNADLNAAAPFDRVNPSAEQVARHIFERVEASLPAIPRGERPPRIWVSHVRVTEAPHCSVVYRGHESAGRSGR